MNITRRHNLNEFCRNLIFSKTFEQDVKYQDALLLSAINEDSFQLKLLKCYFAKNSLKYLAYIFEKKLIKHVKDSLRTIKEFEEPSNKNNVRQYLGKINF